MKREATIEEVALTQYLRPDGRKTIVFAKIGVDYVRKAKDLILSTEVLTTGDVVICGRKKNQSDQGEKNERICIASNDSLTNALKELIDDLCEDGESE